MPREDRNMDVKKELAQRLAKICSMEEQAVQEMFETPPDREMGDLALPCFKLARTLRKAPPVIAKELEGSLELPETVSRACAAGGYLNFYFDPAKRIKSVLDAVAEKGENYGGGSEGGGRTVCIDYSSINIAKRCHIGHLTTTALGNALYKIYSFLGYKCVGINHLGDWGTQFGKLICAYKMWSCREDIEKGGIDELVRLYVRFNNEADEAMEEQARAWFKKVEDDDPEAMEIFNWFKDITLRDVARIYDLLGVRFDAYTGESFYKDKWQAVVQELEDKGLLTESDGAKVVMLDKYDMPPCIILKKDGASIYATRDIAAAIYRKKTYDFYKCLYVVAYQQNLHFRQFFKVIELMGYPWAKDLVHVPFGMVSFEGQTLSTRKGNIVYLDELLERAIEKAGEIIAQKNPELANKDTVARQVGVGAVLFYDLYNSRIKDVDFWWDRALAFEGETGPYVQYTHARACSVLAKSGVSAQEALNNEQWDPEALCNPEAQEVLSLLEGFPQAVRSACAKNEPCAVLRHIMALAQAFNRFYFEHRIITDDQKKTAANLRLCAAVKTVIKTGLSLAGIEAPERM